MKKLLIAFFLSTCAFAASNVQQSIYQLGNTNTWVLAYNWTADTGGNVPPTLGQLATCCQGYNVSVVEIVPGTPSPTAGYAVAIQDGAGVDVLGGAAVALSATAAQSYSASPAATPIQGALKLVITGQSVNSAKGIVYVFLSKPGQINAFNIGRNPSVATGYVLDANALTSGGAAYPALSAACTAANAVGATLAVSLRWNTLLTQTLSCPLFFLAGGVIQPASGQTITTSSTVTAACGEQIFDYSAGGSVSLAFPSAGSCPQWFGAKGDGVTSDTTAFANYVTAVGNGGTLHLPQRATCYVAHLTLRNGQTLQGDGAISRGSAGVGSQLCNDGTSNPMVTTAAAAQKVHVIGLTIDCGATATYGVYLDGGGGNLTGSSVEQNDIQSCATAPVGLNNTYSARIIGNRLTGTNSYPYVIDFVAGSVNGQAQIQGNVMDGAQTACIHITSGAGPVDTLHIVSNTIQSCAGDGIQVNGQIINATISDNHLENNGIKGSGGPYYNLNFISQGVNVLSYGIRVFDNWFLNSGGVTAAALLNSVSNIEFDHNTGTLVPSNAANNIVIGGSVLDAKVYGNPSMTLMNGAGIAVRPSDAPPFFENLFRNSSLMTSTWSIGTGVLSQDGTLGPDGITKAWKITFVGGVNQFSNGIVITNGGHVFGCYGWARTDTGTATLLLDIAAASNYNPLTDAIDSSWHQLGHTASMPASDATGSASCVFKGVVTSGATAIYFYGGQFTEDALAPQNYVPTTSNSISRSISAVGRTVAAQLPSGTGVQNIGPIWVDDSNTQTWGATIAGGGSGTPALAANDGANWTVIGK